MNNSQQLTIAIMFRLLDKAHLVNKEDAREANILLDRVASENGWKRKPKVKKK